MNQYTEYEIFVDARKKANYYKGEILPFINYNCRKNMTTGDIDGFVWDYNKKVYMFLEQKWENESCKDSQEKHLRFLRTLMDEAQRSELFSGWRFGVYKIIGDPPFRKSKIVEYPGMIEKCVGQDTLRMFLELEIYFDEI